MNPTVTPQSVSAAYLAELDVEMPTTRRLLERVPGDRAAWKPHAKSFALGHLAQLVARMPGWLAHTMKQTKLDLGSGAPYSLETTENLLVEFDRSVAEGRAAIAAARDEDYRVPWSLTMGERTLFTAPRAVVMRQNVNHLVHHRGQLTVYLRLLDVPLPSIYGPTADEGW